MSELKMSAFPLQTTTHQRHQSGKAIGCDVIASRLAVTEL